MSDSSDPRGIPTSLLRAMETLIDDVVSYDMIYSKLHRLCRSARAEVAHASEYRTTKLGTSQLQHVELDMVAWAARKTAAATTKVVQVTSPGNTSYTAVQRGTPRGTTVWIGSVDEAANAKQLFKARKLAFNGGTAEMVSAHNQRVSERVSRGGHHAEAVEHDEAVEDTTSTALVRAFDMLGLMEQRAAAQATLVDLNMQIFLAPAQSAPTAPCRIVMRDGTLGASLVRLSAQQNTLMLDVMQKVGETFGQGKYRTNRLPSEKRELMLAHPESYQTQLGTQSASAGQGAPGGAWLFTSGTDHRVPPTLEDTNVFAFAESLYHAGLLTATTELLTSFYPKTRPVTRDEPDAHEALKSLNGIFELAERSRISMAPLVDSEVTTAITQTLCPYYHP
jgi:hypothetical protein